MKNVRPRKAFILAAGFGTRLLPLTLRIPKPLLPVWNRPLIFHTLEMLRNWGVGDVLINLHHAPGEIINALRLAVPSPGLRLSFSFEPSILGTGGALKKASWFFDNEPFWMVNGDVAAEVSCDPFLKAARKDNPLAVLWLHPEKGPRTVEMQNGLIGSFRSKRPKTPGTFTFCGLQWLSPSILDYVAKEGFDTIVDAYERAQFAGRLIRGITVRDSFWADIGSPASLLDAHADIFSRASHAAGHRLLDPSARSTVQTLSRRRVRTNGFVAVSPGVTIASGASLENSIVMKGSSIARGARLMRTIVGPDTIVPPITTNDAMILRVTDLHDPLLNNLLGSIGWNPDTIAAIPLGARGSARTFTRLFHGAKERLIYVRYSRERAENILYAGHAELLSDAGIPVPAVIADDSIGGATLLEDLGEIDLLSQVQKAPTHRHIAFYEAALETALTLHTSGTQAARRKRHRLVRGFGPTLYAWEHAYFAEHFLAGHLKLSPKEWAAADRDLKRIARHLHNLPHVLIHRDLQSTNIFFRKSQAALIDFQGMRMGPALYDIASLLADPYVSLPQTLQQHLLEYYLRRIPQGHGSKELFWMAVVQRLSQALGAYGKLGSNPATAGFARHIPAAVKMMNRALDQLPHLPALRAVMQHALARSLPNESFQRRMEEHEVKE